MIQLQTVTHKLSISIALQQLQFSKSMRLFGVLYNMASMLFCKSSLTIYHIVSLFAMMGHAKQMTVCLFGWCKKKWCISYISLRKDSASTQPLDQRSSRCVRLELCPQVWPRSDRALIHTHSDVGRFGILLASTCLFVYLCAFVWTEPLVLDNIFQSMFINCIAVTSRAFKVVLQGSPRSPDIHDLS